MWLPTTSCGFLNCIVSAPPLDARAGLNPAMASPSASTFHDAAGKAAQPRGGFGPQRHLLHQRLAKRGDGGDQARLVGGDRRRCPDPAPTARLAGPAGRCRSEPPPPRRFPRSGRPDAGPAERRWHWQRRAATTSASAASSSVNSARLASGRRPSRLAFFNSASPDCAANVSRHRQRNRQPAPQRVQNRGLQRRDQPVAQPLHPLRPAARRRAARWTASAIPGTVDRNRGRVPMPGRAFGRRSLDRLGQPGRMIKPGQQAQRRFILRPDRCLPAVPSCRACRSSPTLTACRRSGIWPDRRHRSASWRRPRPSRPWCGPRPRRHGRNSPPACVAAAAHWRPEWRHGRGRRDHFGPVEFTFRHLVSFRPE